MILFQVILFFLYVGVGHSKTSKLIEHKLYIPESARSNPSPAMLVLLHGCTQSPESFMEITRIKAHADKRGFIVLAPQKKRSFMPPKNPLNCWSWYWPDSNQRDPIHGDLKEIMDLVQAVKTQYQVHDKKVFVAGFSAGAVMSSIMASCYPDVFRGAAIHSGIPYRGLRWHYSEDIEFEHIFRESNKVNMEDIFSEMSFPEQNRILKLKARKSFCARDIKEERKLLQKVVIITGKKDKIARSETSQNIFFQFTPDKHDEWIHHSSQKAYQKTWNESSKPSVFLYQINGMGHAWAGGKPGYRFSDPEGPDATSIILEHLL